VRDDKRRHFVQAQVEALKALPDVDVLLTHEAPRPFIVQAGHRRVDAGKAVINELLAAMRPRLHFFGHHHRYSDAVRDAVRSIGLDLVSRSYVLVDSGSFEVTKVDAEA
jgi:Icc-related predicted phosphoesterase